MKNIGIKIKLLREQARISQSEFSHILGISQTTLSNIECGSTRSIDFLVMAKICCYFGKGIDYFLTETLAHQLKPNIGKTAEIPINSNYMEHMLEQVKQLVEKYKILQLENTQLKEQLISKNSL